MTAPRIILLINLIFLPVARIASAEAPIARGLMEPYRIIEVAAREAGVVEKILVSEGDLVTQGDALATLETDLLQSLLTIAQKNKESRGRLMAAQAEVKLQEDRARQFAEVFATGHARPEEVRRAETDLEIARAHLLTANEELVLKQLEYEKIQTQIDRRTVRAPITGIVSQIHKEEGEFVAPNAPAVLTLVQLNPLLSVFSMATNQASRLTVGQKVSVLMSGREQSVAAVVEFIAPITDAESGEILVEVRVDNAAGLYRSGTRCELQLPEPSAEAAPQPKPPAVAEPSSP